MVKIEFKYIILALLLLVATNANVQAVDFVVCESDGHFRRCVLPNYIRPRDASVWIDVIYSKSACLQGFSWGVDDESLWVKRGCRARFAVEVNRNNYSMSHGHDWDPYDRYNRHDSYDRYNPYSPYDDYNRFDRSHHEIEYEKDRLEKERVKLEQERRNLENQKRQAQAQAKAATCQPGTRPGRCSDKDRKHGCKDWRVSSTLVCRSN